MVGQEEAGQVSHAGGEAVEDLRHYLNEFDHSSQVMIGATTKQLYLYS